ncbi:MAG: hypothetical protein ACKOAX_08320, partial [Candidatus Kapaibacterium sp.]
MAERGVAQGKHPRSRTRAEEENGEVGKSSTAEQDIARNRRTNIPVCKSGHESKRGTDGIAQDAAAALHLIEPCGSLARFRDGKLDMFD